MRITRLQLLVGFILLGGSAIGGYWWWQNQSSRKLVRDMASTASTPGTPTTTQKQTSRLSSPSHASSKASAQTIAIVGEAYRTLAKTAGQDIPAVSVPLRTAKEAQAAGNYTKAMDFAKEAWLAAKNFKKTAAAGTYVVAKGDTLWDIAKTHSPVRQGPGWVTIWKANKRLIKDFDWIEVGWTLKIPMKRSAYVMAYWKPRPLPKTKAISSKRPVRVPRPEPLTQTSDSLAELLFREEARPSSFRQVSLKFPSSPVLPPVHYH